MVTPMDVFGGLAQGYKTAQQIQMGPQLNQLKLLQEQAKLNQLQGLDPVSQQDIAASQQRMDIAQQQQEQDARDLIADVAYLSSEMNPEQKQVLLTALGKMGVDFNELTPEELTSMESLGRDRRKGLLGTEGRNFESMTKGLSPEEKEQAKRIKLGLSPRAVGSAAQTIAETGVTEDVAESEAAITGAKESAKETSKLKVQFDLKPQVESAVKDAVAGATARAEIAKTNRSNAKAMEVYEVAMSGLNDALGGTYTGPIVGLVPAMTANQQIATGAVAAMAPVLKQLFRSAGEGTFTDSDQRLLLDMVPTRKDLPEARASKIRNIDAIVRAKLSAQEESPKEPRPTSGQGGRARSKQFQINGVTVKRID